MLLCCRTTASCWKARQAVRRSSVCPKRRSPAAWFLFYLCYRGARSNKTKALSAEQRGAVLTQPQRLGETLQPCGRCPLTQNTRFMLPARPRITARPLLRHLPPGLCFCPPSAHQIPAPYQDGTDPGNKGAAAGAGRRQSALCWWWKYRPVPSCPCPSTLPGPFLSPPPSPPYCSFYCSFRL